MALSTAGRCVSPSQREHCRVIKRRIGPDRDCVAKCAVRWEAASRMVRVCRSLVISLMAGITCRWGRVVIIVCVALRAGDICVSASQRIISINGMIKLGV